MAKSLTSAVQASGPGKLPGSLTGPMIAGLVREYGTPVWVYEAESIRTQIARLRNFDVIRFAQKANSNVHILALMRGEGVFVDAVSAGELERALAAGYRPGTPEEEVVFTSDLLDRQTLHRVIELGVPVNAGSPQMLEQVGQAAPGHPVWLRINPGFGHGHSRKTNTGGENSKHGIWHEYLGDSIALVNRYGLDLVGLHMHIGSGADYHHRKLSVTRWLSKSETSARTFVRSPLAEACQFLTDLGRLTWTPIGTFGFGMQRVRNWLRNWGILSD